MELWQRNMYICVFGVFLMGIGLSEVTPVVGLYFKALGVKNFQDTSIWAGTALSITYLMVALVSPFWGKFADRNGRKLMLLRASLGMFITNTLAGFVTTPFEFLLIRAAQGLVAGYYPAAVALIASQVPKEKSGRALGLLSSAAVGGAILGPLFGGYISNIIGIRYMFHLTSIFVLSTFILTYFFIQENFISPECGKNEEKQSFNYLWNHLTYRKTLLIMAISTFIFSLSVLSLAPLMPLYIFHLLPPHAPNIALIAGFTFSLLGLAQMISASLFGRLIDRIGANMVLFSSFFCAGIISILQGYSTNLWVIIGLRFLLGISLGGLMPSVNTFISVHCPKRYTSQVFSYNQSAQYIGYCLGSLGGAALGDFTSYKFVFWTAGTIFLINALWLIYSIGLKQYTAKDIPPETLLK